MHIEELKDSAGNLLGRIEHGDGDAKTLKDAAGEIKGFYDPAGDYTRDAQQNIVAKGDRLRELIC